MLIGFSGGFFVALAGVEKMKHKLRNRSERLALQRCIVIGY
jgi:hypothetical protein